MAVSKKAEKPFISSGLCQLFDSVH
jgi:hypothetical protein